MYVGSVKAQNTAIPAELKLMVAVLEVYIVDSVAHMTTPVASLVALEASAATLREAHL